MGLFDRAKNAFGGGDMAAQMQAAQQLVNQQMAQAGYGNIANDPAAAAAAIPQMQADSSTMNAYGQEYSRILRAGVPGNSVITALVDTGERTSGNGWFELTADITMPGQQPYTATKRELVPQLTIAQYQVGTAHEVRVDPTDPQKFVLSS